MVESIIRKGEDEEKDVDGKEVKKKVRNKERKKELRGMLRHIQICVHSTIRSHCMMQRYLHFYFHYITFCTVLFYSNLSCYLFD